MEQNDHEVNTKLTSGEISSLWMAHQYESLSICGISFFLQHINDPQIKILLEKALKLSKKRVGDIRTFMTTEGHPIPEGFTNGDVNFKAPRLFSDELYLEYLLHTLQIEFYTYSQSMMQAVKLPIQKFYDEIMRDTMNLEMEAKELSKEKGLFLRSPRIPPLKTVKYVEKESFLAGWFGNRRPLLGMEIAELVFNAKRNALGQAVITAFSQVATTKEVIQYFEKGRDIAGKHVSVLSDKLNEDYLPSASLIKTDQVTDSTESPFSEKLMVSFITTLITSSIGSYGFSMSMSPRHDLGVMYTRLIAEVSGYSNDGAQILINHGWMEQPPMAADRLNLANKSDK